MNFEKFIEKHQDYGTIVVLWGLAGFGIILMIISGLVKV